MVVVIIMGATLHHSRAQPPIRTMAANLRANSSPGSGSIVRWRCEPLFRSFPAVRFLPHDLERQSRKFRAIIERRSGATMRAASRGREDENPLPRPRSTHCRPFGRAAISYCSHSQDQIRVSFTQPTPRWITKFKLQRGFARYGGTRQLANHFPHSASCGRISFSWRPQAMGHSTLWEELQCAKI